MDELVHGTPADATAPLRSPVMAWNEWDPLEEVIVGRLDGATIPSNHVTVTFNLPPVGARLYGLAAGWKYPRWMVKLAQKELDGFIAVLEGEGITVRRPDPIDFAKPYKTPNWRSRGFCIACPRDGFLVIGDEIIETPMCWRSRYFEGDAYRSLFKEYFLSGARWTSAPRPQLTDELFDYDFRVPEPGEPLRYTVNEFEPVFDAADFVRCGRDLFVIRSNVTNRSASNGCAGILGKASASTRSRAAAASRCISIRASCRSPLARCSSIPTTSTPSASPRCSRPGTCSSRRGPTRSRAS